MHSLSSWFFPTKNPSPSWLSLWLEYTPCWHCWLVQEPPVCHRHRSPRGQAEQGSGPRSTGEFPLPPPCLEHVWVVPAAWVDTQLHTLQHVTTVTLGSWPGHRGLARAQVELRQPSLECQPGEVLPAHLAVCVDIIDIADILDIISIYPCSPLHLRHCTWPPLEGQDQPGIIPFTTLNTLVSSCISNSKSIWETL